MNRFVYLLLLLALASCHGADAEEPAAQAELSEEPSETSELTPISGDCLENGCLRWALFLGDVPWLELTGYLPPGMQVESGYSIWQIGFATDGRDAVATLALPFNASVPEDGWDVVLNNPGTVGLGDVCAPSKSMAAAGLAGAFGAHGLIGATIDYPGLGTQGVHPYLVAQVNAQASLDALRAIESMTSRFGIPISGRSAMVGLSQGGHTTLSAARIWQAYAPELEIKAFAATAPATVYTSHWTPYIETAGSHIVYHALLVYAWSQYYGHAGAPIWTDEVEVTVGEWMESYCLSSQEGDTLSSVLGSDASLIFHPAFLEAYGRGDFTDYPFMQEGFGENQLRAFEPHVPIRIYQGTEDQVVGLEDVRELVSDFGSEGLNVELIEVEGGMHEDVAFGYLATPQSHADDALTWIRESLRAPAGASADQP